MLGSFSEQLVRPLCSLVSKEKSDGEEREDGEGGVGEREEWEKGIIERRKGEKLVVLEVGEEGKRGGG